MHLLDFMAFRLNVLISDLKKPVYRDKALLIILHMHTDLCNVNEITETINYLLNRDDEFADIDECKVFIKELLKERGN